MNSVFYENGAHSTFRSQDSGLTRVTFSIDTTHKRLHSKGDQSVDAIESEEYRSLLTFKSLISGNIQLWSKQRRTVSSVVKERDLGVIPPFKPPNGILGIILYS